MTTCMLQKVTNALKSGALIFDSPKRKKMTTLKMEAVSFPETFVHVCQSTQRHIPEDRCNDTDDKSLLFWGTKLKAASTSLSTE